MKKLMMAFAVALTAIGLNAATVNWTVNFGWVSETGDDALEGYIGYMFDGSAYTQLALQEALTTTGTTVLGSTLGDAGVVNGEGELKFSGSGLTYDNTATPTYASALLVIVDPSAAEGSAFTIADLGSVQVTDAVIAGGAKFGGGDDLYTGLVSGWSTITTSGSDPEPVPEPTSGLLLVVGGALLALRRRRLA